jgi:bifunctional polynucleotide phosphatase/kinase
MLPLANVRIEVSIGREPSGKTLLVLVGPPGAGKSTYYRRMLHSMGYEHISQHNLGSQDNCVMAADELLAGGKPVGAMNAKSETVPPFHS